MSRTRNISRIDTDSGSSSRNAHGWVVRLMRRNEKFQKYFSDAEHGGKLKALEAAKKFRDKLEKKNKGFSKREILQKPNSKSWTGYPGVTLKSRTIIKGDNSYLYEAWEAAWTDDKGKRIKRCFSVKRYGYDEAFSYAFNAREYALQKLKLL